MSSNTFDDQSLSSLAGRIEKARSSLDPRPQRKANGPDDESPPVQNMIPYMMGNVGNHDRKGSPVKLPLPPNPQPSSKSKSNAPINRNPSIGSFTAAYFPPEPTPKVTNDVPASYYPRDPENKPPPTEMAILGISDDVSTIANDTLNGSISGSFVNLFNKKQTVTPGHQPTTNNRGEEAPPGFGGTIQIPLSSKDQDLPMHLDAEPRWSGKKYCYAAILAAFLLAAIGALSYGFLKVRDLNSAPPEPVDQGTNGDFAWTFRPTEVTTSAPQLTVAPTTASPTKPGETRSPTNSPTAQPSRIPTGVPTPEPTAPTTTSLKEILGNIDPSVVAKIESGETKHKEAFDWLSNDPEYFSYSESKVVQRWTLALFSLEIVTSRRRLADRHLNEALATWMKYTDECSWFTSWYENRVACDGSGVFKYLVLRNIGLDGTIPSELALLTRLNTVVLSENSITGTIPEQLGSWTTLENFEISSNQVWGSIPSTLGNVKNLVVLDLANNYLTGQIPNELGSLGKTQTIKVNNNQLSGTIPPGISSLESLVKLDLSTNALTGTIPPMDKLKLLAEVNLSKTNLNGAMPTDLCSFDIDILEADCDHVFCSCCTNCKSVGTSGPTPFPVPSLPPTTPPSVSPPPSIAAPTPSNATPPPSIATPPPVLPPTRPPTPKPTRTPTLWPTFTPTGDQCTDSIQTTKTCFAVGEVINLTFKNCLPVGNDWIGIYDSGRLAYELYNPMMWEYSCGSQGCWGAISDGFLSFDGNSAGTESWPLKEGTYKAWIFRDGTASGPYYSYAASQTFTVAQSC